VLRKQEFPLPAVFKFFPQSHLKQEKR